MLCPGGDTYNYNTQLIVQNESQDPPQLNGQGRAGGGGVDKTLNPIIRPEGRERKHLMKNHMLQVQQHNVREQIK